MARLLQVGGETAFCLDVGMADKVSCLRFLAAKLTFFTHFMSPLSFIGLIKASWASQSDA